MKIIFEMHQSKILPLNSDLTFGLGNLDISMTLTYESVNNDVT